MRIPRSRSATIARRGRWTRYGPYNVRNISGRLQIPKGPTSDRMVQSGPGRGYVSTIFHQSQFLRIYELTNSE